MAPKPKAEGAKPPRPKAPPKPKPVVEAPAADPAPGNIEDAWFSPDFLDRLGLAAAEKANQWKDHTNVFARHYAALSEAAQGLATLKRARGGDQLC